MKPRLEMIVLLRLGRALLALRRAWFSRAGRDYCGNAFVRAMVGDIIELKALYLRHRAERWALLAGGASVWAVMEWRGR